MQNMGLNSADNKCCGCSACADICPINAIKMVPDQNGFIVPIIDEDLCIGCRQCQKVCQFMSPVKLFMPIEAYAAMSKNNDVLMCSASGGIFYSLAESVLNKNGVVIGCSYTPTENELKVQHIVVEKLHDLNSLQGSKYVQSDTSGIYKQVKRLALDNKIVLFSGTPCQVAACRSYLDKDYNNVFFLDIICHGTPSQELFKGYITFLEKKHKIKIDTVNFRDKSKGWGLKGSISFKKNGAHYKKSFKTGSSSYYALFLQSQTYRESCYDCLYARKERCGDITIGDYWGIEKQHSEFLKSNGGDFDEKKGISCLIVNNLKGRTLLENYCTGIILKQSKLELISENNTQLRKPSKRGAHREIILDIFRNKGYEEIDKWYQKRLGFKKILYDIYNLMPANKK